MVKRPVNSTCTKVANRELFPTGNVNLITWQAHENNLSNISKYRIYRLDGNLITTLGEINASEALEFYHRNIMEAEEYIYGVSAISEDNMESGLSIISNM